MPFVFGQMLEIDKAKVILLTVVHVNVVGRRVLTKFLVFGVNFWNGSKGTVNT